MLSRLRTAFAVGTLALASGGVYMYGGDMKKSITNSWTGFFDRFSEPASQVFLPPQQRDSFGRSPRTIVIAFEGLLVDSKWNRETGWIVTVRPGVQKFLKTLYQQGYEIVVFSSNLEGVVTPVVLNFDKQRVVSHYIFRENMLFKDGKYIKDLDRMNRDLSKVILIDENPDSCALHPDNAIIVQPRENKASELLELLPFFASLQKEDVRDVRQVIRGYGNFDIAVKHREHVEELNALVAEEQESLMNKSWFRQKLGQKSVKSIN